MADTNVNLRHEAKKVLSEKALIYYAIIRGSTTLNNVLHKWTKIDCTDQYENLVLTV